MKKQIIHFISLLTFPLIVSAQINDENLQQSWIDKYQKAIVSIGSVSSSVSPLGFEKKLFNIHGSGMLFYVNIGNKTIPCLITAKHVFEDSTRNWFPSKLNIRLFNFQDKRLDQYFGIPLILKDQEKKYWVEPDAKNIDLACIPLWDIEEDQQINLSVFPYGSFATKDDYFEGAQLMIFGYPDILDQNFRTRALIRSGIISWIDPKNPTDNVILIDSDIYPGNSGGPVMKIPSGMDKYGNFSLGDKVKFIGIVSAKRATRSSIYDSQNRTILDPSGKPAFTWESVGIGTVESADRVKALLNKVKNLIESGKY